MLWCRFPQRLLFFRTSIAIQRNHFVMDSKLLINADKEGLEFAAAAISQGQLVAFPTETVYGLGANALDAHAVLSIFEAKGRPLTDPLIVHIADVTSALELVSIDANTEEVFRVLAAEFWPGPLTVIMKAAPCIPRVVTANSGFVGLRIPSHPLALEFLQTCRLPIAAPSANRFGHVSPTRAQHVIDDLGEKGVRVLDGDSNDQFSGHTCLHGIESTVLKIDAAANRILILRQGAVSQREVELQLAQCSAVSNWAVESVHRAVPMPHSTLCDNSTDGGISTDPAPTASPDQPAPAVEEVGEVAPGQLVTHYAPYIPCFVLTSSAYHPVSASDSFVYPSSPQQECNVSAAAEQYSQLSKTLSRNDLATGAVVIDFGGQLNWFVDKCLAYRELSLSGSTVDAAKDIFSVLRWAEVQEGATIVLIAPIIGMEVPVPVEGTALGREFTPIYLESRNRIFDPSLGLADRIFRSASGVSLDLKIV
ncbi:sua5 [Symbiodinium microadriaticum]|nr:sua5 [Symbiodinium microadriaticum]